MSLITLATDNFVRANANPLSGSWSIMFSGSQGGNTWGAQQIVSDAAENGANNQNGVEYYNGVTWANYPDQWAQVTITSSTTTNGNYYGLFLRIATTNVATAYQFYAQAGTGLQQWGIQRISTGAATVLTTGSFAALVVGDVLTAWIRGASMTFFRNGTTILTASDGNITSGAAGIYCFNAAGPLTAANNFSAGTFTYDGYGTNDSGGVALPGQEPSSATYNTNNPAGLANVATSGGRGPTNSGVLYQSGGGGTTPGDGQIFPSGRS